MKFSPPRFPQSLCLVVAVLTTLGIDSSSALQIRNYVQLQHDWFFGNPSAPFLNGVFSPSSTLFRAIGQPNDSVEWFRHMALISPRHFVYAAHYPVSAINQFRFLGSDNLLHNYGNAGSVVVKNSLNQDTDLMLCTLSSDVDPATGVIPFPVANFANEAAYSGYTLQVFGSAAHTSVMPLKGFTTLSNDPGFDTTRFAYFDYIGATGGSNDCHYTGGDSGCPTFIMQNGQPVLVGTASAIDYLTPSGAISDPVTNDIRSYLTFIPAYLTQLDTLMEPLGYHVKRSNPAATSVSTSATASGALRRAKSGTVLLTAQNTGAAAAHNVTTQLTFSNAPTTVTGSGWICQASTATVWKCHRGGISNASSAALTATWSTLPITPSMQVTLLSSYDGATAASASTILQLQETFTSWSNGLTDPAPSADPDHDGFSNLLEYAFGGSPTTASLLTPDGRNLAVKIQKTGNNLLIRFPRRTDAAARGLTYTPEVSTTLSSGWSAVLPSGSTLTAASFSPIATGFEEATLTLPLSTPQRFIRVNISLSE